MKSVYKFNNSSGIYTITCLSTNKMYVGYAINLKRRANCHFSKLRKNYHTNIYLQNAWNKYGEENFEFNVLIYCKIEYLASEEHYWATLLNVHDRNFGFNSKPTNPNNNPYFSQEHKNNLSKSKRKQVNQYDLDMNFIKTWKSLYDITGHSINSIRDVLAGKKKSNKKYIWKYEKKEKRS